MVTVVVFMFPFSVPVIVTSSTIVARLEAVVENLKPVAVAAMLTDAGTGRFAELLARVASKPPAGASAERVAAQVVVCSGISLVGVQLSDEIEYVVVNVIVTEAVLEIPPA